MVSTVYSMGLIGMEAFTVKIEADLMTAIPAFEVVGLPDASVRESRDRIRASFKNAGFEFPVSRITINMAPADKRKVGSLYDLPLFVALLAASGQLPAPEPQCVFLGELSLSGTVRAVRGGKAKSAGRLPDAFPYACLTNRRRPPPSERRRPGRFGIG